MRWRKRGVHAIEFSMWMKDLGVVREEMVWCSVVWCGVVWWVGVWCGVVRCGAVVQ